MNKILIVIEIGGYYDLRVRKFCIIYVIYMRNVYRDLFFENKIFKNWKKERVEIDDFFFFSNEEENKGFIIDFSNVICKY